ncbi:acyltransferase family protein [Bacteroides sp. AN502(2024)]|uniref:acyltransferase family protein n=1 Tax=Bacteroides sp. AN502(2024) TaxID=3160599 RepID=UPI003512B1F5
MRNNYFSFMKGLAIIAVLFIHTPFMNGDGAAAIASRQLVTFAVAMFFFLSGYFIKDGCLDLKGIRRILIPYATWSILWFAETTITGSQPVTTWKIINPIFLGGAFFPLYFLIVLVELKLVSPWIVRHIKKLTKEYRYCFYKDWALLITPATLCTLYAIQYATRQQPLVYAQIFPTWFLFYYVGALMKFGGIKVKAPAVLCCTLFGLYLSILESAYINEVLNVPFWAASQIKFSTFFYALSLCLLLMALYGKMERTWIVRLGELSFGIYLLHLPVLKIVDIVVGKAFCLLKFTNGGVNN